MRRLAACLALLSWISLAEWKVFERLQWSDRPSVDFVLAGVQGVMTGTPVSRSWQQRFVGPVLVSALDVVTHDRLTSLELFTAVMLLAANLLLFALLRRRGAGLRDGLVGVACFGFAHLLLAYKLEYPWDGIDVLLFLTFGYLAAREAPLPSVAPLLLLGLFNHETVLYLPLWYLLAPLDGRGATLKQLGAALVTLLVLAAAIVLVRHHFYRGQPVLPGQVFEETTPVLSNHLHLRHNLNALFSWNWRNGRIHLSLAVLSAITLLAWLTRRPTTRRAAVWSLIVIASIVCFGYTNETRHYLPLLAFWFGGADVNRAHVASSTTSCL